MAKPRLKQHDKKERLLIEQLQLIPNLGGRSIDAFRRLVFTTPIKSKIQLDLYTFVAPLEEQVAQSAAAVWIISKGGARVLKQIGINLKLKFEF
uniref:Ribosomal protein S16 n=1 Tax=Microsorum cuspidatum TaxID=187367 RepID=A0A7T1C5P7_9MONI|nr:ribosomal protein S16 [Microsorum cuspidatum]QPM99581.1 ribosomal protein S16 [Microsorum cuspidatum]